MPVDTSAKADDRKPLDMRDFPLEGITSSNYDGFSDWHETLVMPHPSNQLRNIQSLDRKRAILKGTEEAFFSAGTIFYHGGTKTLQAVVNKNQMFFMSLSVDPPSNYTDEDGMIYRFRLNRSITLYKWGEWQTALSYGVDFDASKFTSWDQVIPWLVSGKGPNLNHIVYKAHDLMTQVGSEGRWHHEEYEVGVTPNAYDALDQIDNDGNVVALGSHGLTWQELDKLEKSGNERQLGAITTKRG